MKRQPQMYGMWTCDGCILMAARKLRSKWIELVCIGRKRHYRKDGSCKHTEALAARVKPEFKRRMKVSPFGGKDCAVERRDRGAR